MSANTGDARCLVEPYFGLVLTSRLIPSEKSVRCCAFAILHQAFAAFVRIRQNSRVAALSYIKMNQTEIVNAPYFGSEYQIHTGILVTGYMLTWLSSLSLMVVFIRHFKSLISKNSHRLLLVNLVSADLFFSTLFGLQVLMNAIAGRWVWKEFGCQFEGALGTVAALGQVTSLSLISLDRYEVVYQQRQRDFNGWLKLIALGWASSLFVGVLPFIINTPYVIMESGAYCMIPWYQKTAGAIFLTVSCLVFVITAFTINMAAFIRVNAVVRASNASMDDSGQRSGNKHSKGEKSSDVVSVKATMVLEETRLWRM